MFGNKSGDIEKLYQVLSKTKVQEAQASVESDRVAILEIVKLSPGYAALNDRVFEGSLKNLEKALRIREAAFGKGHLT